MHRFEFTDEELEAVIDETHRNGLYITAHATFDAAINRVTDFGIDCIEHGGHMTDAKIEKVLDVGFILNKFCIKNSNYYNIYKKFPFIFEFLSNLKSNNKYAAATSKAVYPFLYGESSISNIVKRFPVNYLFKPLFYISSILMLMYWLYYQKIFNLSCVPCRQDFLMVCRRFDYTIGSVATDL